MVDSFTIETSADAFPMSVRWPAGRTLPASLASLGQGLDQLGHSLAEHGAILFRGLPITNAEDFDAVVARFGLPNFPYEKSLSNAVRINKTDRVFTANEAPADIEIFLHHEMAQTPIYPTKIFFCCLAAPATGGQTPLCRSDVLLERLRSSCPGFVRDCADKGLKYSNVMPGENDLASGMGRSWQSTLSASTKAEAETRLGEINYSWEWLDDGCLRVTTPVLPAIRTLPDGRATFFNQLIAAFKGWRDSRNDPSKSIRHGDDTQLDQVAVQQAIDLADEIAFDLAWQQGDVALVDNLLVMHGRRPFSGSRSVLASLASAEQHATRSVSSDVTNGPRGHA